jgi:hypothetical protein
MQVLDAHGNRRIYGLPRNIRPTHISFSNHFVNIRHVRNLEIGVILYCQHRK